MFCFGQQVKGGTVIVNAADEDPLDEEAERIAFMSAVEEWRRGDSAPIQQGKIMLIRDRKGVDSAQSSHKEGMWTNPFAAPAPSSPPLSSSKSLFDGDLDEEKEREEFRKAVESWRSSGSQQNRNESSAKPATESSSASVGNSVAVSSVTTKTVAESLANQLEQEKENMFRKIQQQKVEAENRLLAAAKELETLRTNRTIVNELNPLTAQEDDPEQGSSLISSGKVSVSLDDSRSSFNSPAKSSVVSPVKPSNDQHTEESKGQNPLELNSNIKMTVVESLVGCVDYVDNTGLCVVEYESD